MPLEEAVALEWASGNQALKGHNALFNAMPTAKRPTVTVRGKA